MNLQMGKTLKPFLNIELHIEYLKLSFKNTENLTVRMQCLKCLYYYFTLK